jgi:hypothetical protein
MLIKSCLTRSLLDLSDSSFSQLFNGVILSYIWVDRDDDKPSQTWKVAFFNDFSSTKFLMRVRAAFYPEVADSAHKYISLGGRLTSFPRVKHSWTTQTYKFCCLHSAYSQHQFNRFVLITPSSCMKCTDGKEEDGTRCKGSEVGSQGLKARFTRARKHVIDWKHWAMSRQVILEQLQWQEKELKTHLWRRNALSLSHKLDVVLHEMLPILTLSINGIVSCNWSQIMTAIIL